MLSSVTLAVGLLVVSASPYDSPGDYYAAVDHQPYPQPDFANGGCDCPAGYCDCGVGHHHARPHVVRDFLFSHGDMHQHLRYYPADHGYYYFRPYNHQHIARHQNFVMQHGGDRRHPYANTLFDHIYRDYLNELPSISPAVTEPPPSIDPSEPHESPSDEAPAPPNLTPPSPPSAPFAPPAPTTSNDGDVSAWRIASSSDRTTPAAKRAEPKFELIQSGPASVQYVEASQEAILTGR